MTEKMDPVENFLSQCKYYGGAKFRKDFFQENERYAKMWEAGDKKEVEEELEYVLGHSDLAEAKKVVKEAINQMSFEDALQATLKIIHAAEKINEERVIIPLPVWAKSFLMEKIDPENLEEFLASALEPLVSPNDILSKFATASPTIRKMLLEKYSGKISLRDFVVFGEKSIFDGFEDRQECEAKVAGAILASMTNPKKLYRERTSMSVYGSFKYAAVDAGDIENILKFLDSAIEAKVIPDDCPNLMKEIGRACDDIDDYFSDSYRGRLRQWFADIETKIEKMLGQTPEGITGKGLEFAESESGAKRVYLNGELVCSVANASFSDEATNGEIVAWVVTEQIDYCTIKGAQIRKAAYAWKKDMGKPKELFEDHAYSAERYFTVHSPKVTTDGRIVVVSVDDKETKTREYTL